MAKHTACATGDRGTVTAFASNVEPGGVFLAVNPGSDDFYPADGESESVILPLAEARALLRDLQAVVAEAADRLAERAEQAERYIHPSRVTPTVGPYWITGLNDER